MKKRARIKRPLFYSWILSYLLVLLPMMILCYGLYYNNTRVLESNLAGLQQTKAHEYLMFLESSLNGLRVTVNQVYTNPAVVTVTARNNRAQLKSTDYTHMADIKTMLRSSVRSMGGMREILFYTGASDYAVTSTRVLPLDQLYQITDDSESLWGSQAFLEGLLSDATSGWLRVGEEPEQLFFCANLMRGARLVCTLSPSHYLDMYEKSPDIREAFALVSANGDVLMQRGDVPISSVLDGAVSVDAWDASTSNAEWLVTVRKMTGWEYFVVTAISREDLSANLLRQSLWMLAAIPFCVLACFLLIFFSAKRHYNPVAGLLKLADEQGLDQSHDENEYSRLYSLLHKALNDRQKLWDQEAQKRSTKEDQALLSTLSALEAQARVQARFTREGKDFHCPYWCYIEMVLLDFSRDDEDGYSGEDLLSVAQQLVLDMLEQSAHAVALNTHHRLLFLVGLTDDQGTQSLLLKSNLQRAALFLRESYSAEFQCLLSAILPNPGEEQFSRLSAQLMEQLDNLRQFPDGDTQTVRMYQRLSPVKQQMLLHVNRLEQDIRDGQYGEVHAGLTALDKLSSELDRESAGDPRDGDSPEEALKQQVIALVQSQYFDPNLNVSAIARRLGRNPDVVSRIFRQTTHIGPLEYIHYVRIKAARSLLKTNPEMTVRRVAEMCGYATIDSFQRAFKRYVGTTPGRYRENNDGDNG